MKLQTAVDRQEYCCRNYHTPTLITLIVHTVLPGALALFNFGFGFWPKIQLYFRWRIRFWLIVVSHFRPYFRVSSQSEISAFGRPLAVCNSSFDENLLKRRVNLHCNAVVIVINVITWSNGISAVIHWLR